MNKKSEVLYKLNNLNFSYAMGSQKVEALRGVSSEILAGLFVTISGPSGSGKSTLLNILGLIEDRWSGELAYHGTEVNGLSERKKNKIRRHEIGFIFQQFHLFPILTAEENVAYFLRRQGLKQQECKARVHHALEVVGLIEHRQKRPKELSGGQQQRVAIARALAKGPRVILGDELTASLDQQNGREVMEILAKLVRSEGISLVLASHDQMVHEFADIRYDIRDGMMKEEKKC